MLNIKTIKNSLVKDSLNTAPYCFHSISSETLRSSELASEMADYNSSFTAADCNGILSILDTVVRKNLKKGNTVQLPFCTIRPTASGTCDDIQDGFVPGTKNHKIGFKLSMDKNVKSDIITGLSYKQVSPDLSSDPHLYNLCKILDDASESTDLRVTVNQSLLLKGRNLSFEISDEKQGVFLTSDSNKTIRITRYTHTGTNKIIFIIPESLTAGTYTLSLTNKPGVSRYSTASIDSKITLTF